MTPVLYTMWGSRLYGLDTPTSDLDIRGVFIPSDNELLGLKKCDDIVNCEKEFSKFAYNPGNNKLDATKYSLKYFLYSVYMNRPEQIEMLFTDANHWISTSNAWNKIYSNAHSMVSKKTVDKFCSAALGTLKHGIYKQNYKEIMHAYRYVIEAEMLMRTGGLDFPLNYNLTKFLKTIKAGQYLADYEKDLANQIDKIKNSYTVLPDTVDYDMINEICVTIYKEHLKIGEQR